MANKAPPYSTSRDRRLSRLALLAAVDQEGLRPAVVGDMPDDVKSLKDDCLEDHAQDRPTFRDVLNRLVIDHPSDDATFSDEGGHHAPHNGGQTVAFVADSGSVWFDEDVRIVDAM
mmetsp:Transcript_36463/g.116875  ORF Transcript_36463/g.116875 Transcript_36463/m.116875 type:complete len:116 (-) Transcript_36463:70-417(-)